MSLPSFYEPKQAASWSYRPDIPILQKYARIWQDNYHIKPARQDAQIVELLIIDAQKDFCLPEGTLFVAGPSGRGAVEDSERIAVFLYHALKYITRITLTLDSHYPLQIFFNSFWHDHNHHPPAPFTTISSEDIQNHIYDVNPIVANLLPDQSPQHALDWARQQALYYTQQLEKNRQYNLTIWPYHTLVGNSGHALVGIIEEATLFHSLTRQITPQIILKGENPWSEHYSAFGPEVLQYWTDTTPSLQKNTPLIKRLLKSDKIIFVGQASSHCLRSSVDDLLYEMRQNNPKDIEKVYIVADCTSPVCVFSPDQTLLVDYSKVTQTALKQWQEQGAHIVLSTTPLQEWPQFF